MLRPATHIRYHITAILAAHGVQFVAQYKRWKYQVTTRMKKAHRKRQWRFPKSKDFLKQYPCFASMLNKLWNLTWYAHIGACLLDPRFSVQYIGRYTKRAVLAEYRIVYYDGKIVRFSYKDYAHRAKTSYMTFLNASVANAYFVVMSGVFSPRRRLYEPEATRPYFTL